MDLDDALAEPVAHSGDAPAAADLLRALEAAPGPPGRRGRGRFRSGWYIPLAAAAAVAAVVAGSLRVGGLVGGARQASRGGTRTAVRLSCPVRYAGQAPWVPARPVGVDGRARLVPSTTPRSALVCAYDGSNTARQQAGWALSGRRRLTGGLAALAALLSRQPRAPGQPFACTDVGGKQTNYLIGLAYRGGGRIWVAATHDPNDCVATTNGEFTSPGVVGPTVTRAFAAGRWSARQPAACGLSGGETGRLGQETVMVPPGSTSLTICGAAGRTLTTGLTAGYQALTSALNALPARPSAHSCSGGPGPATSFYELLFSYPQGPPVQVTINGDCRPAIDNGSLQSPSARTILPIIHRLLATR